MSALQNLADISHFFRQNKDLIYYVNASSYNLLGIEEWISNFRFINSSDSFTGQHPHVFVPGDSRPDGFNTIEAANNYLLQHPAVATYLAQQGPGGKALFLMFDQQTEQLARRLGLEVCLPAATLRQRLDNKVTTTRIANQAGVPSVPNVLAQVDSYATLRQVSQGLGPDLVVQLPYGDSGKTTFFIATEGDYDHHAQQISQAAEVKIMKRIVAHQATIEACVTRQGILVGPLMTELIGFKELTPYPGGWCGNELFAGAFSPDIRRQAHRIAQAIGQQLRRESYWGYFGLDFLLDRDTSALYLGELNPRLTGATPLTTQAILEQQDVPLFFYHLLEHFRAHYCLNLAHFNQRWTTPTLPLGWSHLIIDHTAETSEIVTQAPASGIWRLNSQGTISFLRPNFSPQTLNRDDEGLFIRLINTGQQQHKGTCIGRLITRGRLMNDNFQLNERAKAWIRGLRSQFSAQPSLQ